MASFIGFVPVDNPRLAIVVVLDEPRTFHYGGVVSAPVFSKVSSDTLGYLQVQESLRPAPAPQGAPVRTGTPAIQRLAPQGD
jgi:cell division protein FtsI (penicillin-binding protein 3)